jgi:hypothetical protein
MRTSRTPRNVLVGGLVLAALGVMVLFLVAFVRWRWIPLVGLATALFLTAGTVLAGATQSMLATPSDVGPFVGSVIQLVGLAVAVVAGVVAVARARVRAQ